MANARRGFARAASASTAHRRGRYAAISALPERERAVMRLRFFRGLTQERVARVLGVSQVQVSRIERRAVETLRGFIG